MRITARKSVRNADLHVPVHQLRTAERTHVHSSQERTRLTKRGKPKLITNTCTIATVYASAAAGLFEFTPVAAAALATASCEGTGEVSGEGAGEADATSALAGDEFELALSPALPGCECEELLEAEAAAPAPEVGRLMQTGRNELESRGVTDDERVSS